MDNFPEKNIEEKILYFVGLNVIYVEQEDQEVHKGDVILVQLLFAAGFERLLVHHIHHQQHRLLMRGLALFQIAHIQFLFFVLDMP